MGEIVYLATGVFQVFVFLVTIYYFVLGIMGLMRKKEKKNYTPSKKFAMIVAAHNEEVVIGRLIESMKNQDYPKELFDIFIIADNCTDNTANVAREHGVNVYERFNKAN